MATKKKNTPLTYADFRIGQAVLFTVSPDALNHYAPHYPELAQEAALSEDGQTIADQPATVWQLMQDTYYDRADKLNPKEIIVQKLFLRFADGSTMEVRPEDCTLAS